MSNHKIVRLKVANVMRIKAAEVKPNGNLIVVGGKNGNGKTSLIQSIAMALGGKDAVPPEPVRKGEERAQVVLELEDLIVTRTFTAKGSRLSVSSKEGAIYPSPQKILDELVGKLMFDPLAFSRMKAPLQAETLRVLAALDFAAMDAKRAKLYEERTAVNREAKAADIQLKKTPQHEDAPAEGISIVGLTDKLEAAEAVNRSNVQTREQLEAIEADGVAQSREIEMLQAKIKELQHQVTENQTRKIELATQWKDRSAEVEALQDIDATGIKQQIRDAEGTNQKVRENAARLALAEQSEAKAAQSATLTQKMEKIDANKAKALREAKLPIEGLGLSAVGVTFQDLPFEQCSSAEQLRISVAMGMAMNPNLRILMIRDGSLLDEDSLAQVAEMAKKGDYQIWLERVGEGQECSVIMEDGAVKGIEQETASV